MLVSGRVMPPTSQLSPPFFTSSVWSQKIQGTRHHSTGMVAQRRHPHWTVSFETKKKTKKWDGTTFCGMETQKKILKSWKLLAECFLKNPQLPEKSPRVSSKCNFSQMPLLFFGGGAFLSREQEMDHIDQQDLAGQSFFGNNKDEQKQFFHLRNLPLIFGPKSP